MLDLCRELVAAGLHPTSPLEAWRGDTLSLRVRSIGEGARLAVEDDLPARNTTPSTLAGAPARVWRRLTGSPNCKRRCSTYARHRKRERAIMLNTKLTRATFKQDWARGASLAEEPDGPRQIANSVRRHRRHRRAHLSGRHNIRKIK